MTRRNPSRPLLFDEEIDHTVRRNQREIRHSLRYTENKKEDDTQPSTDKMAENQSNQLPSAIAANQKPAPQMIKDTFMKNEGYG
ncbi:hypothetical protein PVK06_011838 [Gossypium arboreum]|uniref:Uncharacterized protein n=1 Tax=Gossypium arboreum TaxID=29729 RepID=A0ABR0QAM6_GOSAR|nr:hypothetical protein PVK06_011838 [Gossypium arboreum]